MMFDFPIDPHPLPAAVGGLMRRKLLVVLICMPLCLLLVPERAPVALSVPNGVPTITSMVSSRGSSNGGTQFQIFGTGFQGTTAVLFNGVPAQGFNACCSNTQIENVRSPPGTGVVQVTVVTPEGTSSIAGTANDYTYVDAPNITSVSPSSGPVGTPFTVTACPVLPPTVKGV